MKKKYFLIHLLVFLKTVLFSQQIVWIDTIAYCNGINPKNIATDSEQNIYVEGNFGSNVCCAEYGVFFHKYNSNGNLLSWDTISCPYNTNIVDGGTGVDSQNNAFSVFRSYSNFRLDNVMYPPQTYVVKRNIVGQIIWAIPQNFEFPYHTTTDVSNNFYVASSFGGGAVKKYNSAGNCIGTVYSSGNISVDNSKNLYIQSLSLRKHDSLGNLLWTYPNIPGNSRMKVDPSGNCYVHQCGDGMAMGSLIKLSPSGQLIWTKQLGFNGGSNGITWFDGNIYVAGRYTYGDNGIGVVIEKYDSLGNQILSLQIPTGSLFQAYSAVDILRSSAGLYILAVKTQNIYALLLKVSEPIPTALKEEKKESSFTISPNPSSNVFILSYQSSSEVPITLRVLDIYGHVLYFRTESVTKNYSQTIDLSGYPKGVYFLEITDENLRVTRKLIVE